MKEKKVDLSKYRGVNSTVYTGRPQGEAARKELKLDDYDKDNFLILFQIPSDTTTITPSFFLGLLFDSIKKIGFEDYKKKYKFIFLNEDYEIKRILESDIEDGERNAQNTLKGSRGLKKFLNRK